MKRGRPPAHAPRKAPPRNLPHSTVPRQLPDRPRPPRTIKPSTVPAQSSPRPATSRSAKRQVARIIDEEDATLLEVIDNLLNKGVVLTADLTLGLAGVDLVYLRLSAILCAADRVLPRSKR